MASCPNCQNKFKFLDVLKSGTPWSIQCSSCSEKIVSHISLTLVSLLLSFGACWFLFDYLVLIGLSDVSIVAILLFVGLMVEFLWFIALSTGVVKSNLCLK